MTFCNQVLPLHGHARLFRRGKEKGGYTCSLVEVFSPIKSSAVDCRSPCESSSTPAQDLIPKRMNSSNNSSSTLFGSNVGSSRTENTPQRQNLPQHFTDSMKSQLDVKSLKSDLITCDSTVNPKELSGNTVTPERINLPVPDATHKQDESKYDFLSVPLFNRDLLRSTVPNSANLTNEIEGESRNYRRPFQFISFYINKYFHAPKSMNDAELRLSYINYLAEYCILENTKPSILVLIR